ncbi:MAG: hypothetical protein ACT452_18790 [Microthrixaceae bacterium]
MTDHHDPLDELASAHLDGETTSEEAALLAADPDHAARMARLVAARDAVRAPIPAAPAHARDRAIAAALTAADELTSPAGGHADTPLPLAAPLAPRRGTRRALQLAGIAAAVALLALAVPLLGSLDSGSTDRVAAPPEPQSLDASKGAAASDSAAGFGASEQATAGATLSDDLGSFDDLPGLTEAVRGRLSSPASDSEASASTRAAGASSSCSAEPDAGGRVIYAALAVYEGRNVVVFVREDPDGGRTLVVLDRTDCSELAGGKL